MEIRHKNWASGGSLKVISRVSFSAFWKWAVLPKLWKWVTLPLLPTKMGSLQRQQFLTSCSRAAATICPDPLLPPWAPKRLAPPSRRQRIHSRSFPRPTCSHAHRCSRLTRQHGGEQSGLVTLTFDLLTLKVVSESSSCLTVFIISFHLPEIPPLPLG